MQSVKLIILQRAIKNKLIWTVIIFKEGKESNLLFV